MRIPTSVLTQSRIAISRALSSTNQNCHQSPDSFTRSMSSSTKLPAAHPPEHQIKSERPPLISCLNPLTESAPCSPHAIANRSRQLSTAELSELNKAISTGHKQLNKAIAGLKESNAKHLERMKVFFGPNTDPRGIEAGLKLIKARLTSIKTARNYYLDPIDTPNPVIAFTFVPVSISMPMEPKIFVRKKLFELRRGKQANILIHEAAHSSLLVTDVKLDDGKSAYGIIKSIGLGLNCPKSAVQNADNWALFANSFGYDGHVEDAINYQKATSKNAPVA